MNKAVRREGLKRNEMMDIAFIFLEDCSYYWYYWHLFQKYGLQKMIDSSTSFLYVEGLLFNYSQVDVNL